MSPRSRRAIPVIAAALAAVVVTGLLYLRSEVKPAAVVTRPIPRLHGDFTPAFDFLDAKRGWALVVEFSGPHRFWIFATDDGAAHWRHLFTGVAEGGSAYIHFFDPRHGFVYAGALYRTVDGGSSWQALPMPTEEDPNFTFATATKGWLLGPLVYTTDDGGTTWTSNNRAIPPPVAVDAAATGGLAFRAGGEGWLGAWSATPVVYLTTDGGVSWRSIDLPNDQPGLEQYLTSVRVLPGHGVLAIVGGGDGYFSDDLGATWRQVAPMLPQTEWLADASFLDATHWWAARFGFLYKTSTAGEDWARVLVQPLPSGWNIGPVHAIDVDHGWWSMVATGDSRDWALMTTSDGGAGWRAVNMPQPA